MRHHPNTLRVISDQGLVAQGFVVNNVSAILITRDNHQSVPDNPAIWDQQLLESKLPAEGTGALRLLLALWKRTCLNDELKAIAGAGHFNAACRELRDRFRFVFDGPNGFYFRIDDPNGSGKKIIARRIISRDITAIGLPGAKHNRAGAESMRKAHGDRCDIGGERGTSEVDHRIPKKAALADKRPETYRDTPTPEEVANGEADKHFQVLCKKHNDMKREACNRCLNGEYIFVPLAFRGQYKVQRNGSCEGCFWFGRVVKP